MLKALAQGLLGVALRILGVARQPVLRGTFHVSDASLSAPVRVRIDKYGVPHIEGKTERDVAFAQGWVHAANRLWQMEGARRAASGRLSELADAPQALEVDRLARTLRIASIAAEDFSMMDDEEQQIMRSYVRGINSYLRSAQYRHPIEFTLAGITPDLWTVEDVASICRLLAVQMSHGWFIPLLMRVLQRKLGSDSAICLPEWDNRRPTSLPKGKNEVRAHGSQAVDPDDVAVDMMHLHALAPEMQPGQGSNAFCVSGEHTASGKPMLASDPHLRGSTPMIWYQVHVRCEEGGLDVAGVSVPGVPLITMGHSDRIAWGITLTYNDVADIFEEHCHPHDADLFEVSEGEFERCRVWEDEIAIKGARREPLRVRWTRHGPLLSDLMDVHAWTAHDDSGVGPRACEHFALRACFLDPSPVWASFRRVNKAHTATEFATAARGLKSPSLNFAFATVDGDIGYVVSGNVPQRSDARDDGSTILPGYDGKHEWKSEFVPEEDLPFALNPEQGFLVTANHRITGPEYPHFLGNYFLNGIRGARITKLLHERIEQTGHKITTSDMLAIMCDVKNDFAHEFVSRVLSVVSQADDPCVQEAIDMLRSFDGDLSPTSTAASVYTVLRYYLFFETYGVVLGRKLALLLWGFGPHEVFEADTEFFTHDTALLVRIMDEKPAWVTSACGPFPEVVLRALSKTVDYLQRECGSLGQAQYGKIHRLRLKHGLGDLVPVFSRGGQPVGGDNDTPQAMCWAPDGSFDVSFAMPSFRHVSDLANISAARCIVPGGQCGHLGNRHYDDRTERYVRGELDPMVFAEDDIAASTESEFVLISDA